MLPIRKLRFLMQKKQNLLLREVLQRELLKTKQLHHRKHHHPNRIISKNRIKILKKMRNPVKTPQKKMKIIKRRLITVAHQFQKAVDHLFEKLGKTARYQNRDVLIFLLRPDMVVSVGFSQAHTATNMMKMRISDAPFLKINEIIYFENKEYTVSQEPMRDTNNLTWNFEVVCS
nr:MAG TPA: hypothetical protein [Caudoviricetes sp.]